MAMNGWFGLVAVSCLMVALIGGAADEPVLDFDVDNGSEYFEVEMIHNAMGTTFGIVIIGKEGVDSRSNLGRIARAAFEEVDAIEALISSWKSNSQTSQVNAYAAERPVRVAARVMAFFLEAKSMYEVTDGAFDCTVGPLIDLWRDCRENERLPSDDELAAARAGVGFDAVKLDASERTVSFDRAGMRLNFGGIGKGYALDQAAEVLKRYGVTTALVHGGMSTVVATGAPPGVPGWTVRVRDPYNKGEYIAEFVLRDEAFSTSSIAIDAVEVEGIMIRHIVDPRTGMPVDGVVMAMVVTATGTKADALSTAFCVMGSAEAEAFCRVHEDVRAVIVTEPEAEKPGIERIGFGAGKEENHE